MADGEPFQLTALFDIYELHRALGALLEMSMSGSGLDTTEYALYSLIQSEPGQSPTQLARRLTVPLTTMSDWLLAIERRGHLARASRPTDRRSHGVSLTDRGAATVMTAREHFGRAYLTFVTHLAMPETELRAALATAIAAVRIARNELNG